MSGTYSSQINSSAHAYGVPPSLVKAVATQESSLGQGSQNVMQVNGMDKASPVSSIDAGTRMLAQYYKETGGDVGWTLAMYNMGPGIYQWAQDAGINDPSEAMSAYSAYQQERNPDQYKNGYGDPDYITHVTRYL